MKDYRRLFVVLLSLVFASLAALPASATYGVDQWRVRLYMLPPADALGNQA